MGYMRHDAIVVTSWSAQWILDAYNQAIDLGLQVLGPSEEVTNDYRSILICPDGSKEGWPESDTYNQLRLQYIDWLNSVKFSDGSSTLSWVAVSFNNDYHATITAQSFANRTYFEE